MKKTLFFSFILFSFVLLSLTSLSAQFIKGQVVDYQQQAIPYVSIFIKELAMGTSTNETGYFEIKVPDGSYTCSFQHLSYETTIQTIEASNDKFLHITLIDKVYDLPMVTVGGNGEDPAYDMMRKAIAMAPFYNNQLNQYNAEVYIKGTLKIDKIAGIVKAMAGKELNELQMKEGDKFLQESVNEIRYNQGKFTHTVKSISNTFPSQVNVELGMMNYNIYSPSNNGILVSPLSPQAFTYYRFTYEGFSAEGNYIVNRIKVTPKHKNAMTFEGYIYLSDGYWNVHRFELSNDAMGVAINNKQTYGELEDNVWMPISNNVDVQISMLGNKAVATYVTSIRYKDYTVNPLPQIDFSTQLIKINESVQAPTSPMKRTSEKSQKLAKEIEELLSKNDMSNRDAFKVSRLLRKKEKEDKKQLPDSLKIKNPLNLSDRYKIITDKDAKKRDSIYWSEIRPVPLMEDELTSYYKRDSINAENTDSDSLKTKKSAGRVLLGVMAGSYYKIDSTISISHNGLIDPESLNFNVVDGWTYKQSLNFTKRFKDTTRLNIDIDGQYAFNRKRFLYSLSTNYNYRPEKQGRISVSAGVKTTDFNYSSGLPNFDNMITSLFFRKNYKNYFEIRYVTFSNRFEIINGLSSYLELSYQSRKQLENSTDYSFFYKNKRDYRPNIPLQNPYIAENPFLVADHDAAIMNISLSYTPQMYYRMNGRNKYNAGSKYPTFGFMWRKGIKNVFNSESDFDHLEFSIRQNLNLGPLTSFRYNAVAGWFPNNSKMHFADFKNFNIKEYELLFSSFERSYNLLTSYMPATNEWYATVSAQYSSPFLLLKKLPVLNRTMIQENLYFSYLTTPYLKNYTEVGYGLTNIWLIGSLGVFAGFEKFEYSNCGFKVVINLTNF